MRRVIRTLGQAATLALACLHGIARADAWPDVKTPADASVETVASDMLLNGKPCRMVQFDVHATADDVVAFYRKEFGAKRVENRVKGDPVIATRVGDYFVTVQVHSLDADTVRGTAMTTRVAGMPVTSAVMVDTERLFPADTQVVSTVQTNDSAKRSVMVIGVNRNSVRANQDHLIDAMADRGFRLTTQGGPPDASAKSVSLQLASPAEEASVTISDAGAYRSVVIHRIQDGK